MSATVTPQDREAALAAAEYVPSEYSLEWTASGFGGERALSVDDVDLERVAQAIADARAAGHEADMRLRDACCSLLAAVSVGDGDGKIACPNAFIGPVRAIYEALRG